MKRISLTFFGIITSLVLVTLGDANAKTIKALFIGNSYTQVNNLPEIIKQMALSTGDTLEYSSNTPGGYSFQGHTTNATTLSLIASGGWDYVILQEQSQRPAFSDGQVATDVYPYAKTLDSLIHISNPCATTLFYVTWGRKNGDASNCTNFPPLCTYQGMDSLLQLRYTIMAENYNAALSPVAMLWRKLRTDHSGIELYDMDESHPSANGSYAAACAFYTMMFQKDPTLCTYNFSVSAVNAQTIRTVAKGLVYDSTAYWNRFVESPLAAFNYSISGNAVTFNNISDHAQSYIWDFGDGNTDTAANPVHTYTASGTYEVMLTAKKNSCENSITHSINVSTSGIKTPSNIKWVDIFPNPVTDELNIRTVTNTSFNTLEDNLITVSIYSTIGVVIKKATFKQQENTKALNISDLPTGIYTISISDAKNNTYSERISIIR